VLGIEDGRRAVGQAAPRGDNWLKRESVPPAFTLAEGRAVSFRHVIGAVPRAGREPPASLAAEAGRMRLSAADGATRDIPFDGAFLRIGRTVAP